LGQGEWLVGRPPCHENFTCFTHRFHYTGNMETESAAAAFAALGQPTRLALIQNLQSAGPEGLPAGEIAESLGVPPSTLSFHLRALEDAGLITPQRQGRQVLYANAPATFAALVGFLGGATAPIAAPGRAMRVLFLCTRNSARSIMAEAILNRIGGGRFRAYSAGSEPAPDGPLPEVLAQLQALGHDVAPLRSKSWEEFSGPDAPRFDFIIALCDTLEGQRCPDFGDTTTSAAWPLPDPAKFSGSGAERATLLNELYAALRRRLEIFISLPFTTLDRMALQARVEALGNPMTGANA
jgi:ArsR family transcriptional regulator, arsenate/arsenite/antimonite-responsive transcriptional repressor / arsenate reductase (thioredoxin)